MPSAQPTDDDEPPDDWRDAPTCDRCGDPRPLGSDLCPSCEQHEQASMNPSIYDVPAHAHPPHGNTTR